MLRPAAAARCAKGNAPGLPVHDWPPPAKAEQLLAHVLATYCTYGGYTLLGNDTSFGSPGMPVNPPRQLLREPHTVSQVMTGKGGCYGSTVGW